MSRLLANKHWYQHIINNFTKFEFTFDPQVSYIAAYKLGKLCRRIIYDKIEEQSKYLTSQIEVCCVLVMDLGEHSLNIVRAMIDINPVGMCSHIFVYLGNVLAKCRPEVLSWYLISFIEPQYVDSTILYLLEPAIQNNEWDFVKRLIVLDTNVSSTVIRCAKILDITLSIGNINRLQHTARELFSDPRLWQMSIYNVASMYGYDPAELALMLDLKHIRTLKERKIAYYHAQIAVENNQIGYLKHLISTLSLDIQIVINNFSSIVQHKYKNNIILLNIASNTAHRLYPKLQNILGSGVLSNGVYISTYDALTIMERQLKHDELYEDAIKYWTYKPSSLCAYMALLLQYKCGRCVR